jgi:hypothetical protein
MAQRANAQRSEGALMRKPLSMENYLEGRAISDPIHLFDCVMPCAKAEAFLVRREEHARAVNPPFARVQSAIERHNAYQDDPIQYRGGWAVDRDDLRGRGGPLQCLTNLDLVPPTGALLVAAPLKIRQGSGSPLRVLALVETQS